MNEIVNEFFKDVPPVIRYMLLGCLLLAAFYLAGRGVGEAVYHLTH